MAWSRRLFLAAAGGAALPAAGAQTRSDRLAGAARYSGERGGIGFLVTRHGVVLAERYDNGGAQNTAVDIRSATKALVAPLAGALVRDELLNIDEPVALTIGVWGLDPNRANVTVRALLDMTSGLTLGAAAEAAPTIEAALAAPGASGQAFFYEPTGHQIFAEIARRKLELAGMAGDVGGYLNGRALAPLGVAAGLRTLPDGLPSFAGGATMTTRACAALGELMRLGGLRRAQYLLDPGTVEAGLRGSGFNPRFGFGWHVVVPAAAPFTAAQEAISDVWRTSYGPLPEVAFAAGEGGQRIFVLPTRGVVIARLSREREARGWSDAVFLRMVLDGL